MKNLVVNVKSALDAETGFTGMIQYDDGVTSIATRYTDKNEFLVALEAVYEYVPAEEVVSEDT
jgi:hypothetical protein